MRPVPNSAWVLLSFNCRLLKPLQVELKNESASACTGQLVVQPSEIPTHGHQVIERLRRLRLEVELLEYILFSSLVYHDLVHKLSEHRL